jgi:tetratricopeptide (TPR) repeat protein
MDDLRAGNAAFKDGRYEQSVEDFTRAIMSGKLGADALAVTFNNRGVAYGELGDYDRAILDYNEALGLRPDDATSIRNLRVGHVKRGIAEANLGEVDAAIADFTKAIELDPSHYLAYLRRGQVLADSGQHELAIPDLEKAQTLAPGEEQARVLLARSREQVAASRATGAPAATPAPPAPAVAEEPAAGPAPVAEAPAAGEAAGDGRRMTATQAVNMRTGPGNSFERIATLPAGTAGAVLGEERGWFQLRLADGRTGWVYEKFLDPQG